MSDTRDDSEDFSLKRFRARHQFAANGHMAGLGHEVTPERIDFPRDVADVELAADRGAHIIEAGAAVGQKRAVALLGNRRALLLIVFIGNIADDEFHQILDRDQSVATAVFVDHKCKMNPGSLHLR